MKSKNALELTAEGIEFEVGFRFCCRNFDTFPLSFPHNLLFFGSRILEHLAVIVRGTEHSVFRFMIYCCSAGPDGSVCSSVTDASLHSLKFNLLVTNSDI